MSIWEAIIQGLVQGLSEFLPISSSGHLSLVQHFTSQNGENAVFFSILLHAGTLVAVFLAFRQLIGRLILEFFRMVKDIFTGRFHFRDRNPERNMIIMLFISLLPLLPFYLFKDFFEKVASDQDILVEGFCFLYTALLLFLSDRCVKGKKTIGQINVRNAVTVGVFQGVALLPGVSRSGSTITSGLFCGFSRETAVQFSFILGIPAILGGILTEIPSASAASAQIGVAPMIVGFVTAAVVGFLAIQMVSWLIKSDRFRIFAVYTALLGLAVISIGIYEHITGTMLVLG